MNKFKSILFIAYLVFSIHLISLSNQVRSKSRNLNKYTLNAKSFSRQFESDVNNSVNTSVFNENEEKEEGGESVEKFDAIENEIVLKEEEKVELALEKKGYHDDSIDTKENKNGNITEFNTDAAHEDEPLTDEYFIKEANENALTPPTSQADLENKIALSLVELEELIQFISEDKPLNYEHTVHDLQEKVNLIRINLEQSKIAFNELLEQQKEVEEHNRLLKEQAEREIELNRTKKDPAAEEVKAHLNESLKISGSENTSAAIDAFLQLRKGDTTSNSSGAAEAASAVGACLAGALSAIPPSFCYKKNADVGKQCSCPTGYKRSGLVCQKYCDSDYEDVLGVCWKDCKSGYKTVAFTCVKFKWFKTKVYTRDSYIAHQITDFSDRCGCSDNYYKWGALCYRDCAQAGLINCGIGACAASSESCGASIGAMALEFVLSAAQAISLVCTLGASSAAQPGFTAAKSAFNNISKSAMKKSLANLMQKVSTGAVKATIKAAAKRAAIATLKKAGTVVAEGVISVVCEEVANLVLNGSTSVADSLDLSTFDITGISSAVTSCKNPNTDNEKAICAKNVLGAISTVDVTGLTGMASALIQETCPYV